ERTQTVNDLLYVGPKEKAEFLRILLERLHDRRLEVLVKSLFRPSYGGNRNFTLMYTLGSYLVSADDDMRPETLVEDRRETLKEGEICRGRLVKSTSEGYSARSFDILSAFLDVLGRRAGELPNSYARGELIVDTSMHLETNATKGLVRQNSLLLEP